MRTLFLLTIAAMIAVGAHAEKQWYKGVTHVHSLWSDGDMAPELITKWYKDHGYDFVCFSDHNILQQGERYMSVIEDTRLTPERLEGIRETFGDDWVDIKEGSQNPRMRLKTHDELLEYFAEPGKFLLIQAEEITSIGQEPHLNAINLREVIKPGSGHRSEVTQQYIDAIRKQSQAFGVPMIGHLNHLNFSDGMTIEEVLGTRGLEFMEVYNGHPGVHTWGWEKRQRPSSERKWDVILSMRQENEKGPLYGVATDDSHEYYDWGTNEVNPGRGWSMVYADKLEPDAIVAAMQRGDFYASTGVTLESIVTTDNEMRVTIAEEDGVDYRVEFIGTRKGFDRSSEPARGPDGDPLERTSRKYSDEIGQVLAETDANPAVYQFTGDEIYVRATVYSTKAQHNPVRKGDKEMAWVQPVMYPKQ